VSSSGRRTTLFARRADESYRRSLLVYRTLGITNDVYEQDMRDLQLDFLFNFGGHKAWRKEVPQRENYRWTAERRGQLEFCIATGPREERFSDSFFTITSDLNRPRCPSPYGLNRMNQSKQVPADLPANGSGRACASSRRGRL
jgi:hypothetical protein